MAKLLIWSTHSKWSIWVRNCLFLKDFLMSQPNLTASFHSIIFNFKRVGTKILPTLEFIHEVRNCRPVRVARYEYCSPGPPFLIGWRNPCRDNWDGRSGPREKIPSPHSSINKMESVMDDQAEIFQIRQKLDRHFWQHFLATTSNYSVLNNRETKYCVISSSTRFQKIFLSWTKWAFYEWDEGHNEP